MHTIRYQNKDKQSQFLELLSKNSSYEAKLTALTLQNARFSRSSETIWLFLAYLQLASQIFLLNLNLWSSAPSGNSISWFIVSLLKLMNPGCLFAFQGGNEALWVLLIVSFVIGLSKYMNFLHIVYTIIFKTECSPYLMRIWKIAFQLQGRALYSVLSSIWVSIIVKALQNELTIPGFGKIGTVVLLLGFLIIEFMFCLVLRLRYYTVLPTKSLLSSKSPAIEAITLTQKFILQILQIIFASISYMDGWANRSICVMFTVIRNVIYFKTLPVWSLRGLRYQGIAVVVTAALDITCFFQQIVLPENAFNFIVTVWIVLSLLLVRASREYIDRQVMSIALGQTENTSIGVIQQINIIKQLHCYGIQHKNASKNVYFHLIKTATRTSLISSLQSKLNTKETTTYDPDLVEDGLYQIFIDFLEFAQITSPKDTLLKLYLAKLWVKKHSYGSAMSILANLQQSSDRVIAINATLLILKIQEIMNKETVKTESEVNIHRYLKTKREYIQTKKKILQQTDLQIDLYLEIMKDNPDLSRVFNHGQKIDTRRQRIEKEIKFMMSNIPDYYLSPLLMCAYYSLIANHSLTDFSRYLKIYSHRKLKYAKSFECENIIPENCYQESNAFVLVSGQKESLGKICFCTESLSNIYGGDINLYLGGDVSIIAPFNPDFDLLFSTTSAAQKRESVIGHGFQGYCRHKTGQLIKLEFYVDIFPILTNGFYYCILIRSISREKSVPMTLTEKSILYKPEKELSRVPENGKTTNEEIKHEELRNGKNESDYESSELDEVEQGYIRNSTSWKPKEITIETPRKYQDTYENNDLGILTSQRTESALLTRRDGAIKKIDKYMKKKPDSVDSQDQYRENYKKDRHSINKENWDRLLENPEQARVSQTFNSALVTKFYGRPLRIAYTVFYVLLFCIVIAQVILKGEINNTMTDLKTKKEILRNAQIRDFNFVNIARVSRFLIDEVTGIFNSSAASSLGLSVPTYLTSMNTYARALIDANQNIQINAGLLTKSLRETLFEEDIRLYIKSSSSIETTSNMTNFEATDHLTQSILKALVVSKNNINVTAEILKFVVSNSLNDLLIKSESNTQLIMDSIESDTNQKRIVIEMIFMAFSICLTVMSVILLRIIFMIYSKEKSSLLTLAKLDPDAISRLQSRLNTFKKVLETESLIENKDTLQSLRTSVLADFQRKYRNRNNLQSAKYGGIMRKYLIFAVKFLLCNYAIMGVMAWNAFSASDSIKSLHTEQVRMTFANQIDKTGLIAYLAYRLLYGTSGTAEIRDEPVGVQLSKAIDLISTYENEVISVFRNDNGEYDPVIGKMIFGHTCKDLTVSSSVNTCGYLVRLQMPLGLMSIMSSYQRLLIYKNDSYYSSNMTLEALQAIQAQNFDLLVTTHRTLIDEAGTIASRTNDIFNQEFNQAESQATLILLAILVLTPFLAYLAWIFAFRQLRESDNKLKVLMKSYPANLILSNYLLKLFLIKTSRNALDPIRSYL